MSQSIQLFKQFGLTKSNISYSEIANSFLTAGYTSEARNTYFNSIRVAEGILIKEDVGVAHWGMTFLNGIKIYSIKDKTLIADARYHALKYGKETIKSQVKNMLLNTLREASLSRGIELNETEAVRIIDRVLNQALNEDQRKILMNQTQKYLK